MLNENAKKWVEALRSGEFEQGRGCLCKNKRYCCLAVGIVIAQRNGVHVREATSMTGKVAFDDDAYYVPEAVRKWLGLASFSGSYGENRSRGLDSDNDSMGFSFSQIADIIESEPEGLFVEKEAECK